MDNKYGSDKPDTKRKNGHTQTILWFICYIVSNFYEYNTKQKKEAAQDRATKRLANATVVLAVFTFVLAGIGYLQWREFQATNRDFEATQRSFIIVDNFEAGTPQSGISGRWQFFPILENGGNSSAIDVVLYGGEPIEAPIPVNKFVDFKFNQDQIIHNYIAPKSKIKLKGWEIPENTVERTRNSPFSLYLWGVIAYKDRIAGSHITRFCYRVIRQNTEPAVVPIAGAAPDVVAVGCNDRRFTCADEDCKKYDEMDGSFPSIPSG